MLDVSKLEKRWLKYKIKKILPYGLLLTAIVTLGILIPSYLFDNPVTVSPASQKKERMQAKPALAIATVNNEEAMILEPSMNFIESMTPASIPTAEATANPPVISNKSRLIPNVIPAISPIVQEPKIQPPVMPKVQPVVKGKSTSITRDDAAFDIHELEERFKNNSNPNLGLYIARYHYDHGNYTESYNYALKTNAISSTMEESWLIFAKSLVKLGKEDQAKKTLQLYISNSNSQSAKNYLDTLNKEPSR
ncbi:MAG: hypothetical protein Q8N01_10900 [Sulfuricurvum sp.]|nr:hypothetical protein [Sulfuricurvum sp.]MDP3022684.1 hypothetical protein [Sulfuricurvum sp.]MDP3120914.1 hypothetical protein [Sulfuricurvum sp.]